MKRKTMIFLTSLIVLVPMLVGILLWNQLPEELPIHFNAKGVADNWESKSFVVFLFPLFLLAVHLLCGFVTLHDPKKQNISDKMFLLVLLIVPVTSLIGGVVMYSDALGLQLSINMIMHLFLGLLFLVLGNYLPKSRQNYTIGIKLPWTLSDTDNWNKTHRLAGRLWIICGLILLVNAFLDITVVTIVIIVAAVAIPTIYSFVLYKQKN